MNALNYRNKRVGTFNAQQIDLNNINYTISFNRDKTRAWHFFSSGECFYKWEADYKEPEQASLIIDDQGDRKTILLKPQEVK